jgi:ubiquinone/menaquinone biosynthesis C-methylase UbiE
MVNVMLLAPKSINYWPDTRCAKAFWNQYELPPYQELLRDTAALVEPAPGQRWLDLGCGCGQLTKMLWTKSQGRVGELVGVDIAPVNELAYAKIRTSAEPKPVSADTIRFVAADFSNGLPEWRDGWFDGIVSGLALQYAESFDKARNQWTRDAYIRILAEAHRLLRPGGTFVFSVNVPEPAWGKVAWTALAGTFRARRPLHYLKKSLRIYRYGNWLKREARRGRFHYLPQSEIEAILRSVGFTKIEAKMSFAGQAYLFKCSVQ